MSSKAGFLTASALLVAVNVGGAALPGWAYLPLNVAGLAVLLGIARRAGATPGDLGLRPDRLARGLCIGAAAAVGIGLTVAAAAAVPALRDLFRDDRAADASTAGLLYQVAVRIPIGTALFEEAAFRGVLTGLGRRAWGRWTGTVLPALLFGLWHIIPAVAAAHSNQSAESIPTAAVVVASVVGTAAAGLAFTWLRDRADSLAVPVLAHAALNASAFAAAWLIV